MLDLDPYGGTEVFGMFPLFLKRTADVLALRLAVVFWRLLRLGSFLFAGEWIMSPQFQMAHLPTQWPITDQFPLTPLLPKVFERLVSVCLGRFMECRGVHLNT